MVALLNTNPLLCQYIYPAQNILEHWQDLSYAYKFPFTLESFAKSSQEKKKVAKQLYIYLSNCFVYMYRRHISVK